MRNPGERERSVMSSLAWRCKTERTSQHLRERTTLPENFHILRATISTAHLQLYHCAEQLVKSNAASLFATQLQKVERQDRLEGRW